MAAKRKKAKKKDPNKPKRATTAYLFYCASIRPQVRAENPESSMTDHQKLMTARWKVLIDEDKKPFVEANAKDKERYMREMEAYTPPPGSSDTDEDELGAPNKKKPKPQLQKKPVATEKKFAAAKKKKNPTPNKSALTSSSSSSSSSLKLSLARIIAAQKGGDQEDASDHDDESLSSSQASGGDWFDHGAARFKKAFEETFTVTKNGALQADKETRRKIEQLWAENGNFIHYKTGVHHPPPVFRAPARGDIRSVNSNKVLVLQYYGAAFGAYMMVCKVLKLPVSDKYKTQDQMQAADDDDDDVDDDPEAYDVAEDLEAHDMADDIKLEPEADDVAEDLEAHDMADDIKLEP